MNLPYNNLTLHVDYDVTKVIELKLEEALNEYGTLEVVFGCKEANAEQILLRSTTSDVITLKEGNTPLFAGTLREMQLKKTKGEVRLVSKWNGFSAALDITPKDRAITGTDLTFAQVAEQILAGYEPSMFSDSTTNRLASSPISGFLLQYKETDWDFLKRLAGRAGCVLIPDNRVSHISVSYGLPKGTAVEVKDDEGVRRTAVDYGSYAKAEAKNSVTAFLQDYYQFRIKSQKNYALGQAVRYEDVEGVIARIVVCTNGSLIEKYYDIVPRGGAKAPEYINRRYAGLHLLADVTEVSDTRIRVDFDMEQLCGSNDRYFSYAVESSAWYCMPEKGSKVHVYLPENDETKAYAVHSMRNTKSGAAHGEVASNPSVKSFTHPSGSAMQLSGDSLVLTAGGSGETKASFFGDGTLGLKAKKIVIKSAGKIKIGTGEMKAKQVNLTSGTDISVITGQGAYAYLGEQAFFKGSRIENATRIRESAEIPTEILNRNAGISETIASINETAKAVEKQKIQEAKQKTGMGILAMAIGAVAIAAVCVCTCGAGLVAVAAVAGTTAIVCGASMAAEGVQDYQKAVERGDFSQSYNFMRDTVLGGNQTLYDILTYGSVLICGIVIGVATGGAGLEALKSTLLRTGMEMGIDGGMSLIGDYIDDGSINNGWDSYFKTLCSTGGTAGLSLGAMNKLKGLEDLGKLSCSDLSKIRLGVDVGLDSLVSFATTGEVDLGKIFLRNFISNKLTLADPVDGATGSLYIPAVDMKLPDLEEDFIISRKYESINPRSGLLGHGWVSSLESFLQYKKDVCYILCTDGHIESFHQRGGEWQNDKENTKRITLKQKPDCFELYDALEKKTYTYGEAGKLLRITDGHGNHSDYIYENGILRSVTTFAGGVIKVEITEGRLRSLKDVLGRSVTYTYDEKGHLTCVNQNGRGLTRYVYDKKGCITEITDQNNKHYTKNTIDNRGRVTGQNYPDKSSCEITYDDAKRTVTFYYPQTGGRQKVHYNEAQLVTLIEYQDNTFEAYEYDKWQNRTRYVDRNGNETLWEYSRKGEKIKEVRASGLETEYVYDEAGYLLEETDNEASCKKYSYDSRHYLQEKKTLVSKENGKWISEKYSYDKYGRLCYTEDGRGNRTTYSYEEEAPERLCGVDFLPSIETSPEGYEYFYGYDEAGRKRSMETEGGSEQYSYNSLHHVTTVIDGEGKETHAEYDNLGSLLRHYNHRQWKKSRNGGGYTYKYDYLDRLIEVKDPLGRIKRLVRNGQGSVLYESPLAKPNRIPENDRSVGIRSTYDANDYRTTILCPDGGIWETTYDAEGNLLYENRGGKEGSGRYYTYNSLNQVTSVKDEKGRFEKQYIYDKKGRLIQETNALGQKTYYAYDLAGRRIGVWEYAGEEEASCYRVTQYLYDNAGNVVEERRGKEAVDLYEYPHHFLSIQKQYDKQNRLISVEDGTGARATYDYDARNNCTKETQLINEEGAKRQVDYTYDRAGRLAKKEESYTESNGKTESSCTTYTYDEGGNLASVTLPEGGTLCIIYDEADRPVNIYEEDKKHGIRRSMVYRYSDICALSREQLTGREEALRRQLNQKLMNCRTLEDYRSQELFRLFTKEQPEEVRCYSGKKALSIFREYQRVYEEAQVWNPEDIKSITSGEEGKDYFTRRYHYDFRGNLLSYEDTLGNSTTATYNTAGELIAIRYADGRENKYAYDSRGNLLSKTNGAGEREYLLGYDTLNRVVSKTDGEGNTTTYSYHSSGQISSITGADGEIARQTTYDIWGRPERNTDGNGNTTTYIKDKWGRVTEVTQADGSVEQYRYDYAGNIRKAIDGLGNETRFYYNGANRLARIQKADQTERSFCYDKEGRCILRRDEQGTIQTLTYNMDSNLVSMTGTFNGASEPNIRSIYTYDEQGYLKSAAEGGNICHYDRDSEGRTIRKRVIGNGAGNVIRGIDSEREKSNLSRYEKDSFAITYDVCGRIASLGNTHYSYDKAGRLAQVQNGKGIRATYSYNKNGMQTEVCCGNGVTTHYSYDSRNRLMGMTAGLSGKAPLLQVTYTYDGNGNRVGKEENFFAELGGTAANAQTAYSYDSRNRLTSEVRNGSETAYTYDHAGNRSSRTVNGTTERYLYNSRNQLTELVGIHRTIRYSYDLTGNLVEEQQFTGSNRVLAENNITTAEQSQQQSQAEKILRYTYDAYNRNIKVENDDVIQQNSYDAEGYRCTLAKNDETTDFVYYNGMVLSEVEESGTTKEYVLGNEYLGYSSLHTEKESDLHYYVTDEQGSIRYVLNAKGEVEAYYQYDAFGENLTAEGITSRLKYNGQIEDELSGLYYLRARYYNPAIGRFTQEDVIYNDGLNLYAYCNSNPVMYCDPSGFAKKPSCDGKVDAEGDGNYVIYGSDDIADYQYNMIENPGPLVNVGDNPAKNFYGGRYNVEVLDEDKIFYRGGQSGKPLGQWFTAEAPESVVKVRIDTAVKPQWINQVTGELTGTSVVDTVYVIKIPKGTVVYTGPVGPQGGAYCGGYDIMQTFIETPWKIDGIEVVDSFSLE